MYCLLLCLLRYGIHYTFSPQFLVDCVPKNKEDGVGAGCWGSSPAAAMEFLIFTGAVIPLDLDYPYAGVQGLCNRCGCRDDTSG